MSLIEQIYIAPASGAPQQPRDAVHAVAGRGLEGDRHYAARDYRGQQLTLVEGEVLDAFLAEDGRTLGAGFTRRNLITRGVALNPLVGRRFRIGEVLLYGVETCEPCATLGRQLASERISVADVVRRLAGCGGLRADILVSGWIRRGDALVPL